MKDYRKDSGEFIPISANEIKDVLDACDLFWMASWSDLFDAPWWRGRYTAGTRRALVYAHGIVANKVLNTDKDLDHFGGEISA